MEDSINTVEVIKNQICPTCHEKTLTLTEKDMEVPYFGTCFLFSMECSSCEYRMSDVEFEKKAKHKKHSIEIDSEEDLKIRVVKSSSAVIKIPRFVEITPGAMSEGYVSNIEGVLLRFRKVLESQKEKDDPKTRKNIKNKLKKLQKIMWGREKATLIIEDKTGNSAIISEKTNEN